MKIHAVIPAGWFSPVVICANSYEELKDYLREHERHFPNPCQTWEYDVVEGADGKRYKIKLEPVKEKEVKP